MVLRRNGATAQRHNGATAQWRKGNSAVTDFDFKRFCRCAIAPLSLFNNARNYNYEINLIKL
jgi:hypothetical protein